MSGLALAGAAESFLGARFHLHGRDRLTGLDCLGLVLLAMAEVGRPIDLVFSYGLRNLDPERLLALAETVGLIAATGPIAAGDVLLFEAGPAQLHLAIAGKGGGIVHAHAGLGRVVMTPLPLPWPLVGHWRLRAP